MVTDAYPELPVYEVNARLPVKDIDIAYTQAELRLSRGKGRCDPAPSAALRPECEPVVGAPEEASEIVLWREGDDFARQLFADGAESFLTEGMTGRTTAGQAFRYRLTAVTYGSPGAAAKSPLFKTVRACDPEEEEFLGSPRSVLRQGDEPFLVAHRQGRHIVLIETRTGGKKTDRLPDTASGLLPSAAVNMLDEWWRARVGELA
ncbi:hypothetical protein ACFVDU_21670 [Streptomyces albidoflavus]